MRNAFVVVLLAFACHPLSTSEEEDSGPYQNETLACEDAVARLVECCDERFDPTRIECFYEYRKDKGCSGTIYTTDVDPAFTRAESDCIRDASCARIRAEDMCTKAMQFGRARSNDSSYDPTAGELPEVDPNTGQRRVSEPTSGGANGRVCR